MAIINEVRISGRAVKDAMRNGNGPFRFTLAFGGGKKRGSEKRWPTEFFDVTWWSNRGEEVRKGAEVLVVGRLRQSRWEKDGQQHSRIEIVANDVSGPSIETDAPISDAPAQPLPPLTPKFPIPTRPKSEYRVAAARPVTEEDPITDGDIPW